MGSKIGKWIATRGRILTTTFVVLKLTNQIDWSWWWVMSPTLAMIGTVLILAMILGIIKAFD